MTETQGGVRSCRRAEHTLLGVIVILTERCNSRCLMCDYWRTPSPHSLEKTDITRFWEAHMETRPHFVTLSGGEPLLHRELYGIAEYLRPRTDNLVLSTNGFLLNRHLSRVARHFDKVIVSLDGARRDTVKSIRGVDVFNIVTGAVASLSRQTSVRVVLKMTIQARNYREIGGVMELATELGAAGVAFTVPDLESGAFARVTEGAASFRERIMLSAAEAEDFAQLVDEFCVTYRSLLNRGFVIEGDLRSFVDYFRFHGGSDATLPSRGCDVALTRLVVNANGCIRPCFFLEPLADIDSAMAGDFFTSQVAELFRDGFDAATNERCRRCNQFRNWTF